MRRPILLTICAAAAAAGVLLVGCHDDRATAPIEGPMAAVSDGASEGNPDFFFLPPLVDNPSSDPAFEAGDFNDGLGPEIEVCELSDPDGEGNRTCVAGVLLPPGGLLRQPATLVSGEEHYKYEWDTQQSSLDATKVYRILAFVGTTELGFVDVRPVDGGMRNVKTAEEFTFNDGRTLPVRMRIENDALCDPPDAGLCASKTIDPAVGGEVVLATGERVIVPAQDANGLDREFTLTLQLCDGIDVDLPTFGNCLEATADPPLDEETEQFSPFINVLMCSILDPLSDPDFAALSEQQEDFVTLYRQDDNGNVFALPKSVAQCPSTVGSAEGAAPWRFARSLFGLFAPQPLHATVVVFNVGNGGDSPFTSKYQLALPAKMEADPATNNQTAEPGAAVANPPAVIVTDAADAPVARATVHFEVTGGDGSVSPTFVVTGTDGRAQLTTWTLGPNAGTNTARAFGRAIADPDDAGPFMPDLAINDGRGQPPIAATTGEVLFSATASAGSDLVIESFNQSPTSPTSFHLITFTAVVKNIGTGPAGASVAGIDVGGEPSPGVTFPVPALGPGETFTVSRQLCLIAQGYLNFAFADVNDDVAETDETNNSVSLGFTVTEGSAPVMDGHQCPGEWDGATTFDFDANTPEGGTTPAQLFVKNDATNLYLAVRFARTVVDPGNSLAFEFDSDASGTLNDGDDGIIVNPSIGFRDLARTSAPPCPEGSLCSFFDTDLGGTTDGDGAFGNDGQFTVYEFVHPLNSGEVLDFARSAGETLGLFLDVRMIGEGADFPSGFGDTRFPAGGFQQITITSPPVP